MSSDNMLFQKPVSVLARGIIDHDFGPPVDARIQVVQNGFKMRIGEEKFVAKTIDEAMDIMKSKLEGLLKDLKKNDK